MAIILEEKFHRNHESNGKIKEGLAISEYLTVLNTARELSKENKAKIIEIPYGNPCYCMGNKDNLKEISFYGEYRKLIFTRKKELEIQASLKAYRRFGEVEIWAFGDSSLIEILKKSVEGIVPITKKRLEKFIERDVNTYNINHEYVNLNEISPQNVEKLAEIILNNNYRKNTKLNSKIKKLMKENNI